MGTHGCNSDAPPAWAAWDCGGVYRRTPGGTHGPSSHLSALAASAVPTTAMARMHTRRRGSSDSDRPAADEPPEWSDVDPETVEEHVVDLAQQGHSPSEIGVLLRDQGVQGTPVPDVTLATGKKIGQILADHDAEPDLPEDLRNLMERAARLDAHLQENPTDHHNRRALQNTESKIRRLVNYYRGDKLDEEFTYSITDARELL